MTDNSDSTQGEETIPAPEERDILDDSNFTGDLTNETNKTLDVTE